MIAPMIAPALSGNSIPLALKSALLLQAQARPPLAIMELATARQLRNQLLIISAIVFFGVLLTPLSHSTVPPPGSRISSACSAPQHYWPDPQKVAPAASGPLAEEKRIEDMVAGRAALFGLESKVR